MTYFAWIILIDAAILEVGEDALVRKGLRGSGVLVTICGGVMIQFGDKIKR